MNYKCTIMDCRHGLRIKCYCFLRSDFLFWKVFETLDKNSNFVTVVFIGIGIFTENDSPFF